MDEIEDIKRRAGILTESKSETHPYDVKVKINGMNLWTVVYAENVERAQRIAKKLFGSPPVGRPTKRTKK